MSEDYSLKIGSTDVLDEELLGALSSADAARKKKADEILSDRLKECRVRVGTLLKTDNVSFLIGAGASSKAGGISIAAIPAELEKDLHLKAGQSTDEETDWLPLFYSTVSALSGKTFSQSDRAEALMGQLANVPKIPLNLEDYLSQLHTWHASMPGPFSQIYIGDDNDNVLDATQAALARLILEIDRSLTVLCDLPTVPSQDALKGHRRLIKKTLTRPLNLRRANLFTLNYDNMIEKAADAEGAVLVDGFVGTFRRIFRPESYDVDFYYPAQTTEGRVHRFDRVLHLYKLHGSITWHRCEPDWENPYGLFATFYNQQALADDILIYPSPLKYGQALGIPYSELFRRFASAIAQPQSVLFTVGYGFGDEHVNALIRQALSIPSFTLVVVDPAPKNDFVNHLRDLGDERVWLVGGWQLGTFECFVEKLLPDLREEEITSKVIKTYKALTPSVERSKSDPEGPDDN